MTPTAPGIATLPEKTMLLQVHAEGSGPGGYGGHMMGWDGWFMGPVMMVVFFALMVGGALLVIRALGAGDRGERGGTDRALDVLRERFARGEIDEAEFDARRKALDR